MGVDVLICRLGDGRETWETCKEEQKLKRRFFFFFSPKKELDEQVSFTSLIEIPHYFS